MNEDVKTKSGESAESTEVNEVTQRYLDAVNNFIETAKNDVNVIAVLVMGSLTNDVVWEKSDIDATVIVRDQTIKVHEFCLDADGIVLNMHVQERTEFVRSLERRGSGIFMSRAQVMFTKDDSITQMVEQNKELGERDAQRAALFAAMDVVYFLEKAEKWLYVKKDYTYCRYYVVKAAECIANLEIYMAKEYPTREVIQRAQILNPELIQKFYNYPMSRELTEDELKKLLQDADDYLMSHIDYISEPVLDFLEDGEIKSVMMFQRQFHAGGHILVHLLDYFASKGIIEKVSETVRLTPKSRPMFEEIAYMSMKNIKF